MKVELLDQATAGEFWDVLEPLIEAALSYDPYASITAEEVREAIATGYTRVYIAHEEGELLMATATQIYRRKDGEKVLHVLATAGEKSHIWLPGLLDQLEALAFEEGCASVTMCGRPGWARKLRRFGWNVSSIDMEWRLNNGGSNRRQEPGPDEQPAANLSGAVAGALSSESAGPSARAGNG